MSICVIQCQCHVNVMLKTRCWLIDVDFSYGFAVVFTASDQPNGWETQLSNGGNWCHATCCHVNTTSQQERIQLVVDNKYLIIQRLVVVVYLLG